jgi:predicted transposase YbfD/YdcC
MNDNTAGAMLGLPDEGGLFEVGSLYAQFEQLLDKRAARGKQYALALVLVLWLLAKLSGEDRPYGIAHWVQLRRVALCEAFGLEREKLPCHNTYRRVLRDALEQQELQRVVSEFLTPSAQQGQSVLVALDGKTLRGTIPTGQTQGVHLLAAYVPEEGIVLMQVAVDDKENEISAAPQVLKCLDLRGKIVVGDALHTQRKLSAQIVEAGGDYIWTVKDNQPQLRQDIEQVFAEEVCVKGFSPTPKDFQAAHTVHKGHGRLEERTLTTSSVLRDYCDWPALQQVFKLERHAIHLSDGQVRHEIVYGCTSLTPQQADPARLLQLVRGYWGIENGLHYRRDKTLHEDATRISHPKLAQAIAILNNLIIGLVARQDRPNLADVSSGDISTQNRGLQSRLNRA